MTSQTEKIYLGQDIYKLLMPAAGNFDVIEWRIVPGTSAPLQVLRTAGRGFFVTSGLIELVDEGDYPTQYSEGQFVFVPPGYNAKIRNLSREVSVVTIICEGDNFRRFLQRVGTEKVNLNPDFEKADEVAKELGLFLYIPKPVPPATITGWRIERQPHYSQMARPSV